MVQKHFSLLGVVDHVVVAENLYSPGNARQFGLDNAIVLLQPNISWDGPPSATGIPPFIVRRCGITEG